MLEPSFGNNVRSMTVKQKLVDQNRKFILYLLCIFALSLTAGCTTSQLPMDESEIEPAVEEVVESAEETPLATSTPAATPTVVQPTNTPEPPPTVAVALTEPKLVMFWSAY